MDGGDFKDLSLQPINSRMLLLPREEAKLVLHAAGSLAQKRLARGLRLNLTEATALIATVLHELVRDGKHSVAELMVCPADADCDSECIG